jgi:hypothetical protein
VFLHGLRLNYSARPDGFEQLIVCDQPPGELNQIREDREGFRRQQDALLAPSIGEAPKTLVHGIEPEGREDFHRTTYGPIGMEAN